MTTLKLRIHLETGMLGPGRAELLQRIRDTGSISAAGRQMKMSYKRAWTLVEELNAAFAEPLVLSARGGSGGGGAELSPTGIEVLDLYNAALTAAETAISLQISRLEQMLRPIPIASVIPARK